MRFVSAALCLVGVAAAPCDAHQSTSAPPAPVATRSPLPPVLAVTPSPPSYDLAADLAARAARARVELGDSAAIHVEADVFLVVTPRPGRLHDASVELAHDALEAYFNGRFAKRPDRAVTVYVLDTRARYDALCKARVHIPCDTLGLYDPVMREILVDASMGLPTLTHEIVHPIVESDFPLAPKWFDEGLGSLFEMPVIPRAGEIHGVKNWRLPRLVSALASKTGRETTRLDTLFGMTRGDFEGGDVDLHYAMARYVCQWLDARGQLWPFYRAWRDSVEGDPTGEKAFTLATHATPARANEDWVKWIRGL